MDTLKRSTAEHSFKMSIVANIADEKTRAVTASNYFVRFIDQDPSVENMEKLFIYGATMSIVKDNLQTTATTTIVKMNNRVLSLVVLDINKRYPHNENHWNLLKVGLNRGGITLNDSVASYHCVYHYLFHAFYSLIELYGFRYDDVELNANLEKAKESTNLEILKTLQLFVTCNGQQSFEKVFENRMFIFEVMAFFRRSAGQQSDGKLLKFLLEHGLNPNYEHTNPDGSVGISLLAEALRYSAWANAAVLLEYGAVITNDKLELSAGFIIGPTAKNISIRVSSFQRYFDYPGIDGKDYDLPVKEILRTGLENFRKRREEVYPSYLKFVLDPACNLHSSFDVAPLTTIVSEYLLHK